MLMFSSIQSLIVALTGKDPDVSSNTNNNNNNSSNSNNKSNTNNDSDSKNNANNSSNNNNSKSSNNNNNSESRAVKQPHNLTIIDNEELLDALQNVGFVRRLVSE